MNGMQISILIGKFVGHLIAGCIRLITFLPATIEAYLAERMLPGIVLYPALLFSLVTPPLAILGLYTATGYAQKIGMLASVGLLGIIFINLSNWIGLQLWNAGLRWVPGQGVLRQRLGINFSLSQWLEGLGKVGRGVKRVFAPAQGVGDTNLNAAAAMKDETLLRGAGIVSAGALANHIAQHYTQQEQGYLVTLGGVPIPYEDETKHWLLSGRTGAGKTVAYRQFITTARKRGNLAMVADAGGGFCSRFYMPGDFILNPFDARDAGWSPFLELEEEYDCQRIAKAAIPDANGASSNKEWTGYAQSLLSDVLAQLWLAGECSVKTLLHFVQTADAESLAALLGTRPAGILCKAGNEKMLSNTRAIASLALAAWAYLPDKGTFSVRSWVRDNADGNKGHGWLFVTHRDDQMAMLRNMVACWFEIGMVETLALSENNNRRLWFLLDEMDSLGKVSSALNFATKARKYGGVLVAGIQAISQLRETYGRDNAQTLLSCLVSKLVLAQGDAESAGYFEKDFGQQEVERWNETEGKNSSTSTSGSSAGKNTGKSKQRLNQAAIMASEIMNLPDLHGYLNIVGHPFAKIKLDFIDFKQSHPAFESKVKG